MLKDDDRFRREYAAMNLREMDIRREERQAALAEGKIQGAKEKALETAKAMLADGVDINLIVKYTGLPAEKIEKEL